MPGGFFFLFLVVCFILEFFKQNISDKFSCLTFYSNLLKQRQVRNKLKICLVKNTHTHTHKIPHFLFEQKTSFLFAVHWDIFWSASCMSEFPELWESYFIHSPFTLYPDHSKLLMAVIWCLNAVTWVYSSWGGLELTISPCLIK